MKTRVKSKCDYHVIETVKPVVKKDYRVIAETEAEDGSRKMFYTAFLLRRKTLLIIATTSSVLEALEKDENPEVINNLIEESKDYPIGTTEAEKEIISILKNALQKQVDEDEEDVNVWSIPEQNTTFSIHPISDDGCSEVAGFLTEAMNILAVDPLHLLPVFGDEKRTKRKLCFTGNSLKTDKIAVEFAEGTAGQKGFLMTLPSDTIYPEGPYFIVVYDKGNCDYFECFRENDEYILYMNQLSLYEPFDSKKKRGEKNRYSSRPAIHKVWDDIMEKWPGIMDEPATESEFEDKEGERFNIFQMPGWASMFLDK